MKCWEKRKIRPQKPGAAATPVQTHATSGTGWETAWHNRETGWRTLKSELWTAETLDQKTGSWEVYYKEENTSSGSDQLLYQNPSCEVCAKNSINKAGIQELKEHLLGLMEVELSADQQEKLNVQNNAEIFVGWDAQHT